ncbi:hypothetical protein HDV05_006380 [Chytridiales sp. JEL 0842]|nr:hypothetical protein HDV05_006380 [Chytridiales sp. JEL 0842]
MHNSLLSTPLPAPASQFEQALLQILRISSEGLHTVPEHLQTRKLKEAGEVLHFGMGLLEDRLRLLESVRGEAVAMAAVAAEEENDDVESLGSEMPVIGRERRAHDDESVPELIGSPSETSATSDSNDQHQQKPIISTWKSKDSDQPLTTVNNNNSSLPPSHSPTRPRTYAFPSSTSTSSTCRLSPPRTLLSLPPEITTHILSHLPTSTLYQTSLVCRSLCALSNPVLWRVPDPKDQRGFEVMLRGVVVGHIARNLVCGCCKDRAVEEESERGATATTSTEGLCLISDSMRRHCEKLHTDSERSSSSLLSSQTDGSPNRNRSSSCSPTRRGYSTSTTFTSQSPRRFSPVRRSSSSSSSPLLPCIPSSSLSTILENSPGHYIRSVHYKLWFRLPLPFAEMLVTFCPHLRSLPRIGFFNFMPPMTFFQVAAIKCKELGRITLDCLSPSYIDCVLDNLVVSALKDLKLVNLDNKELDAKIGQMAHSMKQLEVLSISFAQSFSDDTFAKFVRTSTRLKELIIDFATGLSLASFILLWESASSSLTRIVFEHGNLVRRIAGPSSPSSQSLVPSSTSAGITSPVSPTLESPPLSLHHPRHNLTELRLVRSNLSTSHLLRLSQLTPNLKSLMLSDVSNVTDDVVSAFATNCSKLSKVAFVSCGALTDSCLLSIATLQELRVLTLDHAIGLTDSGFAQFLEDEGGVKGRLVRLSIYGCNQLSDLTLGALSVSLDSAALSTEKSSLPFKHLKGLSVGGLYSASVPAVLKLIETLGSQLQKLSIAGTASPCKPIVDALGKHCSKHLQELELGKCMFLDRQALEQMLERLGKLKVFYADGLEEHRLEEEDDEVWDLGGALLAKGRVCKIDTVGKMQLSGFACIH